MRKDFDGWNKIKKRVQSSTKDAFYHEREIWWCSLGVNVGYEQDGTGSNFDRPILIIKGFNSQIFFAVALTGRKKIGKYYFYLGKVQGREASVVLSQVRVVDTKRLIRKICTIDTSDFLQIKRALNRTLFDEF